MKQKAPNPFIFHFRWENEHILLILGDIAAKRQQVDVAGNVRFAAGSSLNAHPRVSIQTAARSPDVSRHLYVLDNAIGGKLCRKPAKN